MCRILAFCANSATPATVSLLSAPHSLLQQSCRDNSGEKHPDGWGIGYYLKERLHRVRSRNSANHGSRFRKVAQKIVAATLLAHVRNASAGKVAIRNTHPFVHGRWLFAHNGTLRGFNSSPQKLCGLLPPQLLVSIHGETDSEHAFHLVLARIYQDMKLSDQPADPSVVSRAMHSTIKTLAELYPGHAGKTSEMNFVLTDGKSMWASRWGKSLYWLERRGYNPVNPEPPVLQRPQYRAVLVASEPTTAEPWRELPDRSLLRIDPDLSFVIEPLWE